MKKFWWGVLGVVILFGVGALLAAIIPGASHTSPGSSDEPSYLDTSLFDMISSALTPSSLNVVVFGEVGPEYGGARLADTILLVRFLPDQKKGYLISIPRDLWIGDEKEQFKINEVLAKKKIPQALEEIESLTGVAPDGYAVINLSLVREAIDFLGGVDVTLDQPAIDWVSGYTLSAGTHHLNGEDAVWLLRNRYNREGDFFREKNQQKVVEAAIIAFRKLPREQKLEFVKKFIFTPQVLSQSRIDFSKITPFVLDPDLAKVSLEHVVLDYETQLFTIKSLPIQGAATTTYISVVMPTEGFEQYGKIREYIQAQISQN